MGIGKGTTRLSQAKGKESMNSNHRQSLIARRQQAFSFLAETEVECCPQTFQHMAGLIYYYNNRNYYYLCISKDEEAGKCLYIMSNDQVIMMNLWMHPFLLKDGKRCT